MFPARGIGRADDLPFVHALSAIKQFQLSRPGSQLFADVVQEYLTSQMQRFSWMCVIRVPPEHNACCRKGKVDAVTSGPGSFDGGLRAALISLGA